MTEQFVKDVQLVLESHRPSRHPFFAHLAACPHAIVREPQLLDELYTRYQAAMHATRVMVYFVPHLDTVALRMRKLQVIADDDGDRGGDSHHSQLRRTWQFMLGRQPRMDDEQFGDLGELTSALDHSTAHFVSAIRRLYPVSLGPWVVIEGLAHDWIGALLSGLAPHFPGVEQTDYFVTNYSSSVEVQHAQEALNLTAMVIQKRPELRSVTLAAAETTARELDAFWSALEALLRGRGEGDD